MAKKETTTDILTKLTTWYKDNEDTIKTVGAGVAAVTMLLGTAYKLTGKQAYNEERQKIKAQKSYM